MTLVVRFRPIFEKDYGWLVSKCTPYTQYVDVKLIKLPWFFRQNGPILIGEFDFNALAKSHQFLAKIPLDNN